MIRSRRRSSDLYYSESAARTSCDLHYSESAARTSCDLHYSESAARTSCDRHYSASAMRTCAWGLATAMLLGCGGGDELIRPVPASDPLHYERLSDYGFFEQ